MTNDKPKNMMEVAKEDFQAYLERTSRESNKSNSQGSLTSPRHPETKSNKAAPIAINPDTNSFKALFSPKTEALLNNFSNEQKLIIGKVWRDLLDLFGKGKLRQEFGDEPGSRFMLFATSLNSESYLRLIKNLTERLNDDKDWPPSLEKFNQLKDLPSEIEVQDARRRLLVEDIKLADCNRVEAYIKKHKKTHLRALSERNLEIEFKRLYNNSFREVLYDIDIAKDKQKEEVAKIVTQEARTAYDEKRDSYKLSTDNLNTMGPVGARLTRILTSINMLEPETSEELTRKEQAQLAAQIISSVEKDE
ncbi:hypothetical protein [Vibrio ouci]|uniref:Uncharacterized protein n=1 Tax=Vibrio ouci TaxID=2499078 RepID=A0A4Y8WH01_9VIBR|nr:hypothetical protein [Vibrio ouci]TFH92167.1 hypothetical protein ELS82_08350 [Vibrio ouci]